MAEQRNRRPLGIDEQPEKEHGGQLTPAEALTSEAGVPPVEEHPLGAAREALEPAAAEVPAAGTPDGDERPAVAEQAAESEAKTATFGSDAAAANVPAPPEEPAEGEAESEAAPEEPEEEVQYVEENVVVVRRGPFYFAVAAALLLIAALVAALLYQTLKPAPAVAKVNGASITRAQYDKAVAAGDGQQVLDSLIDDKLVTQDAAHKHVKVSTDEIDAQLKQVKNQFATEDEYRQALDSQHITELSLRDSLRQYLLLQKLTADRTQVSDADVQNAYNQGKDSTYQGKSFDDVKDQIRQQLTQQKQQDATSAYLADLKQKAKITTHLPGT